MADAWVAMTDFGKDWIFICVIAASVVVVGGCGEGGRVAFALGAFAGCFAHGLVFVGFWF